MNWCSIVCLFAAFKFDCAATCDGHVRWVKTFALISDFLPRLPNRPRTYAVSKSSSDFTHGKLNRKPVVSYLFQWKLRQHVFVLKNSPSCASHFDAFALAGIRRGGVGSAAGWWLHLVSDLLNKMGKGLFEKWVTNGVVLRQN